MFSPILKEVFIKLCQRKLGAHLDARLSICAFSQRDVCRRDHMLSDSTSCFLGSRNHLGRTHNSLGWTSLGHIVLALLKHPAQKQSGCSCLWLQCEMVYWEILPPYSCLTFWSIAHSHWSSIFDGVNNRCL